MQIVAALFIEGIDLRQVPGPATRIDLTGVQFSAPAPRAAPVTIEPHLCVIVRCAPDDRPDGALEVVFRRDGETSVALTYMTGALVKIGQRVAAAMFGGPRWSFLPYLGLWAGLVGGAVLGALAHRALGLHALWIATAAAGALTVAVRYLPYKPATRPM